MPVAESALVELRVNGSSFGRTVDTRTSLLDLLRNALGLTGSKKGCDHGQCGACTVLLDGRRTISCLVLAVAASGSDIVTIEGLGADELHPLQSAFMEEDAFQCGFCTSGQLCSAVGMLGELAAGWPSALTDDLTVARTEASAEEIRERMSGNLCRCGAYVNIVAAIARVAR